VSGDDEEGHAVLADGEGGIVVLLATRRLSGRV
jgi:hypothetical protein